VCHACMQGFYSVHTVPIIENTARECELTDRLRAAIKAYPLANAVLVRRHGVYVWGKTWVEAKTQASSAASASNRLALAAACLLALKRLGFWLPAVRVL
jgi:ribulose-5-phosphate 4-epimerase/fuculose-1-phosphate aldolase